MQKPQSNHINSYLIFSTIFFVIKLEVLRPNPYGSYKNQQICLENKFYNHINPHIHKEVRKRYKMALNSNDFFSRMTRARLKPNHDININFHKSCYPIPKSFKDFPKFEFKKRKNKISQTKEILHNKKNDFQDFSDPLQEFPLTISTNNFIFSISNKHSTKTTSKLFANDQDTIQSLRHMGFKVIPPKDYFENTCRLCLKTFINKFFMQYHMITKHHSFSNLRNDWNILSYALDLVRQEEYIMARFDLDVSPQIKQKIMENIFREFSNLDFNSTRFFEHREHVIRKREKSGFWVVFGVISFLVLIIGGTFIFLYFKMEDDGGYI